MKTILKNDLNTLFELSGRYYIVEDGRELTVDNAWCECKTLAQATREFNNY